MCYVSLHYETSWRARFLYLTILIVYGSLLYVKMTWKLLDGHYISRKQMCFLNNKKEWTWYSCLDNCKPFLWHRKMYIREKYFSEIHNVNLYSRKHVTYFYTDTIACFTSLTEFSDCYRGIALKASWDICLSSLA